MKSHCHLIVAGTFDRSGQETIRDEAEPEVDDPADVARGKRPAR